MRHLIAPACLLLLAACAADKPDVVASAAAPAAAASGPQVICRREKIMGSNMNQTVCEPTTLDNDGAKKVLQDWRTQSAVVNGAQPGTH